MAPLLAMVPRNPGHSGEFANARSSSVGSCCGGSGDRAGAGAGAGAGDGAWPLEPADHAMLLLNLCDGNDLCNVCMVRGPQKPVSAVTIAAHRLAKARLRAPRCWILCFASDMLIEIGLRCASIVALLLPLPGLSASFLRTLYTPFDLPTQNAGKLVSFCIF